ncbi:hypothetical protein [Methylobacter sp.]|uniref:hypothetical protein n=1 Tax=Methylobacter sp. TaxID=2051955 RepID=UPI003DA6A68D
MKKAKPTNKRLHKYDNPYGIKPILWSYFTDDILGECRFYQVDVNSAIIQVRDGSEWISKDQYEKKHKRRLDVFKQKMLFNLAFQF